MKNSIRIPANWRLIDRRVGNAVVKSLLIRGDLGMKFIIVAAADHTIIDRTAYGKALRWSFSQASAAECNARRIDKSVRRALVATTEGVFEVSGY